MVISAGTIQQTITRILAQDQIFAEEKIGNASHLIDAALDGFGDEFFDPTPLRQFLCGLRARLERKLEEAIRTPEAVRHQLRADLNWIEDILYALVDSHLRTVDREHEFAT